MPKFSTFFLAVGIVLLAATSHFAYRNELPAELFGDVIEHMQFVKSVEKVPFIRFDYWFGGDGPLVPHIHYLNTRLADFSFDSFKNVTITAAILLALSTFLFAYEISKKNRLIATFAGVLTATSFWSITMSHQAKPYIFVPLFAVLSLYLLLKARPFLSGILIGFGMITQASFWGFFGMAISHPFTLLGGLIGGWPFFNLLFTNSSRFLSNTSYVGEKMKGVGSGGIAAKLELLDKIFYNLILNFRSLYERGDSTFRHNIPDQTHIDIFTFYLMCLGMVVLILYGIYDVYKRGLWYRIKNFRERRISIPPIHYSVWFLFLPFLLVQFSSLLDIAVKQNAANMGRMTGVIPFIMTFAAFGLYGVYWVLRRGVEKVLRKKLPTHASKLGISAGLIAIGFILFHIVGYNLYRYYYVYPKTLPNANTAYGKAIVDDVEQKDKNTLPFLVDCCWGSAGQPEPKGIDFSLKKFKEVPFIDKKVFPTGEICKKGISNRETGQLTPIKKDQKYVFYVTTDIEPKLASLSACLQETKSYAINKGGWLVVNVIEAIGK